MTSPPITAFRFGDTALFGTKHRNRVRDLSVWTPPEDAEDVYTTWMRFTEDLVSYARGHTSTQTGVCPSVEGYAGDGYALRVPLDFDHESDPGVSLEDARTFLLMLRERYGI